ncbi:hypothetical protein [Sphingobacterium haloxyli]|uniref:Uncharacterized protein n=1 Tax=Sphingobacterium haloxyli TaxID=2100533 RepID=A0A2S9J041_9SPHI|nr:hypothetical protein [Sphingobacterium haloxyli]PRD46114.1 hypothetical protein C5745_16965 [Sphingobacterium haloxyli]
MRANYSELMRNFTTWVIGVFLLLLTVIGCQDSRRNAAEKIVKERMGKEIIFPEEVECWYKGTDTLCPPCQNKPFKMLVYTDSIGCTSCKLNLTLWKHFMQEMDSIAPGQVEFAFYFQPKNRKELAHLLRRDRLEQVVFIDQSGALKKRNQFAEEMEYQCFLLNVENKVVAIGNPTLSPKVWDLYKTTITTNK